jgi:hypothetical protein
MVWKSRRLTSTLDWHLRLHLLVDRVLSRAEGRWVAARGGLRRRREARHIDRATGRTSIDHLREGGIGPGIWEQVERVLEAGADPEEVASRFNEVTRRSAISLADDLERRAPQMLREHRASDRGMARRMRAVWGPAFNSFYEIYVCAEELGSNLQQLHGGSAHIDSLLALHARTCLVLAEVHALMTAGFPFGASARTRTLHETAVIASVISEHGCEPSTADLGQRFLEHAAIDEARDIEVVARNVGDVDPDGLARARARKAALIEKYGPNFAYDYGWARPLFPTHKDSQKVTFKELEEKADTGLDRFGYRYSSHFVHASGRTVELNVLDRGGRGYRVTGPTNIGFDVPASVALDAAVTSMSAVVHGVEPMPDPMHLIAVETMRVLSSRALDKFQRSQEIIDSLEARVHQRRR